MRFLNRASVRARNQHSRRRKLLNGEWLENRCMMSIVVSNLNATGPGSLSDAITQANIAPFSTITFSVTGVINQTSPLPDIGDPTTIMGTSSSGMTPVIEINGNGSAGDGLLLDGAAGGSFIEGLSIVNFPGAAIDIQSANIFVTGCDLGVTPAGTSGPNQVGVELDNQM